MELTVLDRRWLTYAAITGGVVVVTVIVNVITAALAMACRSGQQQACKAGQDSRWRQEDVGLTLSSRAGIDSSATLASEEEDECRG